LPGVSVEEFLEEKPVAGDRQNCQEDADQERRPGHFDTSEIAVSRWVSDARKPPILAILPVLANFASFTLFGKLTIEIIEIAGILPVLANFAEN
jgi:hypothetical protein